VGVPIASIAWAVAANMGLFRNHMPVEGKTVLITGASEGMGLSVAVQLAAKGANLILLSRSETKLRAALKSVEAAALDPSTQRFHYIQADVAVHDYARGVLADATAWNEDRSPDIVWCCAGMSAPQLFLEMDMSSMRRQMDINFFGTVEMTQAILREWCASDAPVEKEAKHIIMTGSVATMVVIPGYIPYVPSKAAMRGVAEGLHMELMMYPQNVQVHLVTPGTILSPGFEQEQLSKPEITKSLEKSDPKLTPDEAARAAINGLERGEFIITLSWQNWLMKCGTYGMAWKNNWFIDILVATIMTLIIWPIVDLDLRGQVKKHVKKFGSPKVQRKPLK